MADHEMMNLEEMGSLRDSMELLGEELMNGHRINPNLYVEYDVKRGLRDSAGKGVLTGLTEISDVTGYDLVNGRKIPAHGRLYYQGYNVNDIVDGLKGRKFGFEETIYLLLFGRLPSEKDMQMFKNVMENFETLSGRFVRDVVMKASNSDIMNAMQRCILTLYTYDSKAEDISAENVLRQSIEMIAKLPLIAVYSYHSYRHFRKDETLFIRNPQKGLSLAENILLMLRPNGKYTELEAKVLDIALILHAEHGGGNNSTFTTHVVTSSGTDTYSSIAASIGSLKGPRHGGANLKVQNMFEDIKANVKDWSDEKEVENYLCKILNKEAFDHTGLIYGMGHAVYTLSDPREVILKRFARDLAQEKGMMKEFALYELVERLGGRLVMEQRRLFKNVCANVDFYSGFVYTMLGIPKELFTPIFAIARIPGWSAHRLEEILNASKIIRPAYKYVGHHAGFVPYEERTPEEGCEEVLRDLEKGAATEAAGGDYADKKVGVCIYQFSDNFMTLFRTELENYLVEQGFSKDNITIVDGANDQATQTGQIDNFISEGVDVLIVNPVNSSSAATITDKVVAADIPLVYINREPDAEEEQRWEDNGWNVTYVGCDARQSGTFQGEMIVDLGLDTVDLNGDGKIQYVMVEGDPENVDAQYRTEYSVKALTDAGLEVECLSDQVGNWQQDQAQQIVANALGQYGDKVEVVFCNNDAMALGALQAIQSAGRTVGTDIFLVGVDALSEALEDVVAGTMTGTVFNDHFSQSHGAADAAINFINGETNEYYIGCDYVKVTTDNVADIQEKLK